MKGISGKEMELISYLEFNKKYYFSRDDIRGFFKNNSMMNFYLYSLKGKGRIFRLNKIKYFLVPIRAKGGFWTEHPLIVVDEIMNSGDYYIGGPYAKYYWKCIEQVPRQIDVYSTKKQGIMKIFNITIKFKRIREIRKEDYITKTIHGHPFNIATKKFTKKWMS